MSDKLLSIVLPTYNRAAFLPGTIGAFHEQVERHSDKVSFLVCDNASTDDSKEILKGLHDKWPCIEYKCFKEHVDVGHSITRANNTATGEYILMWGDDDVPAPFFLDAVFEEIEKHQHPQFIHYNRIFGFGGGYNINAINGLKVLNTQIDVRSHTYGSISEFLFDHALDITFLSSIIFKREIWERNIKLNTESHYGYEFLGRVLYGLKDDILYIPYPLCIQRKPFDRPWMNKSPYYRFIGIPNMYKDFEKWGMITSWKELWMKQGNGKRDFLSIMAQTSVYKKEYRPLISKLLESQFSFVRKLITIAFVYLLPGCFYKFIRKRIFKT